MQRLLVFLSILGFSSASCDTICTALFDPVCGYSPDQGYMNFSSPCQLSAQNDCYGSNYSVAYEGVCGEAIKYNTSCDFVCVVKDEPVCGVDSCRNRKNFVSPCALDTENACAGTDYVFNNVGICEEVKQVACGAYCPDIYNPVCGYDRCVGYKEFTSPCWLRVHNSCYNTNFKEGFGCGDLD